ncbi:MAG: hypothetical protein ABI658_21340 [Acidimicrobiales bacterium]
MDRRALFFITAAVACALLVPVTPPSLRYVGFSLCGAYVLLAFLSYMDDRSRHSR